MTNEKGEIKKHRKKIKFSWVRLLILIGIILVVVYFVMSAVKIVNLNKEKEAVEQQNEELTQTVEDLTQQLEIINTDQYMERIARKKLKLVRSNEILFVLPNIRLNEDDEEVGPTDLAQSEAQDMVDAKKAEEEEKSKNEAEEGTDGESGSEKGSGDDSGSGDGSGSGGGSGDSSEKSEKSGEDGNGR